MAIYAIVNEEGVVTNRVDAPADAPLDLFFPGQQIIEETEETGPAFIGYGYLPHTQKFQTARPFVSWSWSDELLDWVAPVPYPQDGLLHLWDEQTESWKAIEEEPADA